MENIYNMYKTPRYIKPQWGYCIKDDIRKNGMKWEIENTTKTLWQLKSQQLECSKLSKSLIPCVRKCWETTHTLKAFLLLIRQDSVKSRPKVLTNLRDSSNLKGSSRHGQPPLLRVGDVTSSGNPISQVWYDCYNTWDQGNRSWQNHTWQPMAPSNIIEETLGQ